MNLSLGSKIQQNHGIQPSHINSTTLCRVFKDQPYILREYEWMINVYRPGVQNTNFIQFLMKSNLKYKGRLHMGWLILAINNLI